MHERPEQPDHDLGTRIAPRVAVHLAVDHKGVSIVRRHRHTAFAALALPLQRVPARQDKVPAVVHGTALELDPARTDGRMTPGRCRARGRQHQPRGGAGPQRRQQDDKTPCPRGGREQRRHGQPHQQQHPEPPRPRRTQDRQQTEPARERSGNRAGGVPAVGQAGVRADPAAPRPEQSDQHRELESRQHRRREHDDGRHHAPLCQPPAEAEGAQRVEQRGEEGQTVAQREWQRDAHRLEGAHRGEAQQRCGPPAAPSRVTQAAQRHPQQRHRQNQPEGERRPAQQRPEHPVPNQFQQKKSEADHRGGGQDKARRGAAVGQSRADRRFASSPGSCHASRRRRLNLANTLDVHRRRWLGRIRSGRG